MNGSRRKLLLATLTQLAAAPAVAQIPLPNFTEYQIPETVNPAASPDWYEYLDLGALVVGLALASYFALVSRSRRGLFLLAIASLAWLGFWRQGCICPIGAIQNVSLAAADPTYVVPWVVVAFFVLPLLFTLFFGRTFCAAVCPLGAVQELVALWPIRVPTWLDHALGLLAYVYLGAGVLFAATGTAFVICRYDPFVAFFRFGGSRNMLLLGAGFLAVGIFVGRPYCRYLCPYGALLGLLSKVSQWHVEIPPSECIQCKLCEDACPYGAIREPTVTQTADNRTSGRRRLGLLLLLMPVLLGVGAWLAFQLKVPMAQLHPTVSLAERIRVEDAQRARLESTGVTGMVVEATDASDAFRESGRTVEDLYREAMRQTGRLGYAGGLFGAWVGLVIGIKLIHLSVRRRRVDYQPDRAGCVSCGRCFWYCPSEQARLGLIDHLTTNLPLEGERS